MVSLLFPVGRPSGGAAWQGMPKPDRTSNGGEKT